MKNPNGYGSVAKLSGNRRKPFIVKKTIGWNDKGYPISQILGYCATRAEGNILLAEYNRNPWNVDQAKITLQELFALWLEKKAVKLGNSNMLGLRSGFTHIKKFASMPYKNIRSFHMQECIDSCGKGYSTQNLIKNLWGHLDRFALELNIITKTYSSLLKSAPVPMSSRYRFSDDEIKRVWNLYQEYKAGKKFEKLPIELIDTVLIFIYSGFRISELLGMKTESVDLKEQTFKGGVKTKAGKNRIVPIHSKILPLIRERFNIRNEYFISKKGKIISSITYRGYFKALMKYMGIEKTVHECRHTFESVLDSNGANRKCIDMLMGHVSKDVGNRVYNHKTLEELRTAIELFKI